MKCVVVLGLLVALSANSYSDTIKVPANQPTIQAAINSAVDGDTVLVAPGTYVENIDFKGKKTAVISSHGPHVTGIDGINPRAGGNGSVVVFVSNEGAESKLDGFSIFNGKGTLGDFGFLYGGGIYCRGSSPILINNIIIENSADCGGGICCHHNSSPSIKNNIISSNEALLRGGGISCRKGHSYPILINNTITRNSAMNGAGGGIYHFMSYPIITHNVLYENEAEQGGGIFCYAFYGNDSSSVTNTIIWNNRSTIYNPEIFIFHGNSGLTATYCDIEGGWPGTGNIDADPLFVDPASNDFHLTSLSPCIGTGIDTTPNLPDSDFEGDPRIAFNTVDMGADEYYYHLYHKGAVKPGKPIEIRILGNPAAPVTLYLGSGLADPPYPTLHGNFYLNWPPLGQSKIGTVPGNGVLSFSATVPTGWGWKPGSRQPLQALVGPWGGARTRLTNMEVLVVE